MSESDSDGKMRDLHLSTSQMPADEPFGAWVARLSGEVTDLELVAERPATYHGEWQRFGLGQIDVNVFKFEPQRVFRTPEMAARRSAAEFELLFMQRGPGDVRHCGADMRVPEGSFVLLDNQMPWQLDYPENGVCIAAHLGEQWLRKWVAHPKLLVARPIEAGSSWGAPLATLLQTIAGRGLEDAILSRQIIADQVGALIALLAGETGQAGGIYQAGLLARARRLMHDRYHEPDLAPLDIANEMGISKRHLHGIFAQSGTTFGSVLLEMRMDRASSMLRDVRFASYRIGDVALACGFLDPGHFARRFKERLNQTPNDYRSRHG